MADRHPIPAPTDEQLELLTQLRVPCNSRASVRNHVFQRACYIMDWAWTLISSAVRHSQYPPEQVFIQLENQMRSLVEEMLCLRTQEEFERWVLGEI